VGTVAFGRAVLTMEAREKIENNKWSPFRRASYSRRKKFVACSFLFRRPHYSDLAFGRNNETPSPATDFLMLEYFPDTPAEALPIGRAEPNEQDAVMGSWNESSKVGEVQVLCDEESVVSLCRFPNIAVTPTAQVLLGNGVNIVVKTC
jgi:hypothetical protein